MRFKVIGTHTVDGVDPGGTVVIDDSARARQLSRAGHLAAAKVVAKKGEVVSDGDPRLD